MIVTHVSKFIVAFLIIEKFNNWLRDVIIEPDSPCSPAARWFCTRATTPSTSRPFSRTWSRFPWWACACRSGPTWCFWRGTGSARPHPQTQPQTCPAWWWVPAPASGSLPWSCWSLAWYRSDLRWPFWTERSSTRIASEMSGFESCFTTIDWNIVCFEQQML